MNLKTLLFSEKMVFCGAAKENGKKCTKYTPSRNSKEGKDVSASGASEMLTKLSTVIHHLRRAMVSGDRNAFSDAQLVECFLSGRDEAAFEELVRRHGPMVLGLCRRILKDGHDSEDAFQATFFVLARKAASITRRETVGGWLHGVAFKTALKAREAKSRRLTKERQAGEMPRDTLGDGDGNWEELLPVLDQELGRLPDKYRVPIVLCDLEGKSRKE